MPSIINSDDGVVSGTSGLKTTGGNDGVTTFQQNGTERMRITAAGNVGIGTSSPIALGSGRIFATINGSTDSGLFLQSAGTTSGYLQGVSTGLNIVAGNNLNLISTAQGTGVISWITAGSERARINSGGQLFTTIDGTSSVMADYGCRAWVNFNGTGTVAIRGSGNVSSITDLGTGNYRVNFSNALPDGNYAVATGFQRISVSDEFVNVGFSNGTTNFNVETWAGGGLGDMTSVSLVVLR